VLGYFTGQVSPLKWLVLNRSLVAGFNRPLTLKN